MPAQYEILFLGRCYYVHVGRGVEAGHGGVAGHVAVLVRVRDGNHLQHGRWHVHKLSMLAELLPLLSIQVDNLQ